MKTRKKIWILMLMVMMASLFYPQVVSSKSKTPSLNKSTVTLEVGQAHKVKINKGKADKIKSAKYTFNKKVSVKKINNSSAIVTAKKAGNSIVKVKVRYALKGKTKNKTLRLLVRVKKSSTKNSDDSSKEDSTEATTEEVKLSDGEELAKVDVRPYIPATVSGASIVLNNNNPLFEKAEYYSKSFEYYSPLDSKGRVGTAVACLAPDLMPAANEKRGEIGSVKPTGWHTVKYPDIISDLYLYNRCHLIGWQLAGENANELNLATGTRYLNVEGMLPYENKVAEYIRRTGNPVLYRVVPVFDGDNLLMNGLTIEAKSVKDDGCVFFVYCPNIQPGISIDYSTGESWATNTNTTPETKSNGYVLNTNSKKFHLPDCKSAESISSNNKEYSSKTRDELINDGYSPCKNCNP